MDPGEPSRASLYCGNQQIEIQWKEERLPQIPVGQFTEI